MRDVVLLAFVFGALPFVLKHPDWGILLWTWVGLMIPQSFTWGFAKGFPLAMIIGVVTIVSILISREKKRLPMEPPVVVLIVFILWMCFTLLFAIFPDISWAYAERISKMYFMIFMTLLVMQTKERVTALVWVVALSLGFFGIKGGLWVLAGNAGNVIGPYEVGVHGSRNVIGIAFIMTIPLMYWLLQQTQQKWLRLGFIAAMVLSGMATLGTNSRGAFLAIAAAAVFLWIKGRNKLLLLIAFLVVVPPVWFAMPESWHERMGTIESHEDGSSQGRLSAWYMAWNLALDRPVVGGGLNCFQPETFAVYADPERFGLGRERWHDAHSIYFRVLGEHGFPGLAIYLVFWLLTWRLANRVIKLSREREDLKWAGDLAAMIQVSIVGFLVGGAFVNIQYWDMPYILLCMLVGAKVTLDRELKPADADEQAPRQVSGPALATASRRSTV